MTDTAANVVMRSAKVEYGATTALGSDFGHVKDVKIKISPAVTEVDSNGVTIVPGYKVEGQFRAMENTAAKLSSLFSMVDGTPYYMKFTDRHTAANSFLKVAVVPYIDTEIDMNGKADGILVKFTFFKSNGSLDDIISSS